MQTPVGVSAFSFGLIQTVWGHFKDHIQSELNRNQKLNYLNQTETNSWYIAQFFLSGPTELTSKSGLQIESHKKHGSTEIR